MTTPQKPATGNPIWEGLNLAWVLGYLIAIPAVVFSFSGAYLDKKMNTSPLYLLIGIGLALVISGIAIYRKTKHIVEHLNPPEKNNNPL